MLHKFYQTHLQAHLSPTQYIYLNLLTQLLQSQKQVRLERLAATLPLPIQFESRRRSLKKFLQLSALQIEDAWFPLVKNILNTYFLMTQVHYVVIDRTRWWQLNLLMVSLVWQQRAIPMY